MTDFNTKPNDTEGVCPYSICNLLFKEKQYQLTHKKIIKIM